MPGGIKEAKPADDHIIDIVSQCSAQLNAAAGTEEATLEPLSYATQTVAGTNYFVKLKATSKTGEISYLHARIFQDLPHNNSALTVHSVQKRQSVSDPLEYFE